MNNLFILLFCFSFTNAADLLAKFLLLMDSQQVNLPNEFLLGLNKSMEELGSEKDLQQQVVFYNGNSTVTEEESFNNLCREVSAGVTIIIDSTATGWPRARLTADALGVHYVRAEASIAPFARAAAAYALRLNASDAAFIFQNDAEMEQALSALLGTTRLRITVHNRLSAETTKLLHDSRPWPDMFILFADTSNMGPLIKAAVGGGLVTQDQQWLIVFLNFPQSSGSGGAQNAEWAEDLPKAVAELRPSVPEMCCPLTGGSAGCECNKLVQVVPYFVIRLISLLGDVVVNGGNETSEPRKYDCTVITADDEATISVRRDKFDHLLAQVLPRHPALLYNPDRRLLGYRAVMDVSVIRASNAGRTGLASWSPDRGLVVTGGRQVAGPRQFVRIGMIESEPWSRYDPSAIQWFGYCVDFVTKLSELMNFDWEIIKPVNASNGGLGERVFSADQVSWTGLIGSLHKKEIDFIVAPMTMTSEREEVIDFVVPYFDQTGISIVIRQPEQSTSLFKFMTVLNPEVWISILGALITTGVMIWLLDYFSPYSFRNDPARYPYPCRQFTLKESFWFALTSFTPQGGGEAPKSVSARALVAAYWLFVVLMLATFTANLAAFLTVERLQVPVQSLEQLARQSRVSYAVQNNSATHTYFKNMRNAEITMYRSWMQASMAQINNTAGSESNEESGQSKFRVWNYPIREQYNIIIDNLQFVNTPQEGIDKVLASADGSYAFIHDNAWLRYQVSQRCLLAEVGEVFAEQPYAIAVSPGHPLTQELSRKVLTLQRDRYFEELSARYWNQTLRTTKCPSTNDGEGISLESIGGVFIATLFGLLLAVITLIGEILYHHHVVKKRKDNKMPQESSKQSPIQPTFTYNMPMPQPIIKKRPSVGFNKNDSRTSETKTGIPKVSYITVYPSKP